MSKIILSLLVLFFSITAIGQPSVSSRATEGSIAYAKSDTRAAQIQLPYSAEVVENAIRDYAKKNGSKISKSKGFMLISHSSPGGTSKDLYFKVQRSGSRGEIASMVSLITADPGENILNRSSSSNGQLEEGKAILDSLAPSIGAFNHSVATDNQGQAVRQAEKALKNLQRDQQYIENQIRKLEGRLNDNKKKQEQQVQEIARQRQTLESMKSN